MKYARASDSSARLVSVPVSRPEGETIKVRDCLMTVRVLVKDSKTQEVATVLRKSETIKPPEALPVTTSMGLKSAVCMEVMCTGPREGLTALELTASNPPYDDLIACLTTSTGKWKPDWRMAKLLVDSGRDDIEAARAILACLDEKTWRGTASEHRARAEAVVRPALLTLNSPLIVPVLAKSYKPEAKGTEVNEILQAIARFNTPDVVAFMMKLRQPAYSASPVPEVDRAFAAQWLARRQLR